MRAESNKSWIDCRQCQLLQLGLRGKNSIEPIAVSAGQLAGGNRMAHGNREHHKPVARENALKISHQCVGFGLSEHFRLPQVMYTSVYYTVKRSS